MDAFRAHLERASRIVRTWPKWKQELLGGRANGAETMAGEINTTNDMAVGMIGDSVVIMRDVGIARPIPRSDALRMAAWIVAIADDNDEFDAILNAVRNT